MFLGIDEKSGLAYEGIHVVELPAVPIRHRSLGSHGNVIEAIAIRKC